MAKRALTTILYLCMVALLVTPTASNGEDFEGLNLFPWQNDHLEQSILKLAAHEYSFLGKAKISSFATEVSFENGEIVKRESIESAYGTRIKDTENELKLRDYLVVFFAGEITFTETANPFTLGFSGAYVEFSDAHNVMLEEVAARFATLPKNVTDRFIEANLAKDILFALRGLRINLAAEPADPLRELPEYYSRRLRSGNENRVHFGVSKQAIVNLEPSAAIDRRTAKVFGKSSFHFYEDETDSADKALLKALARLIGHPRWSIKVKEDHEADPEFYQQRMVMLQNGRIITPDNLLQVTVSTSVQVYNQYEEYYPSASFELIPARDLIDLIDVPKKAIIELSGDLRGSTLSKLIDRNPERADVYVEEVDTMVW